MRDDALLAAYARGNALAFEVLYERHKHAVFAFLNRQCDQRAVAEELAHDAWMAVVANASTYKAQATFKTWLFRIAHNRLIDYWRKFGGNAKVLFEELNDVHAAQGATVSESMELRNILDNLKTLSNEQTEAVLLKIEGFSYQEIADITSSKPETVKSRLRYATEHLRLQLECAS
jgi:RNA polymerase sigma-70 factor (ECF subfamily)